MSVAGFGTDILPADKRAALDTLLEAAQRTPPCDGCRACDAAREILMAGQRREA